ncbi:hypothetical protein FQA39_LY08803 [Lamprigera yunnana]|nr:hypothetical protein FQA39_LY08803 [Lamprigera yunnana]
MIEFSQVIVIMMVMTFSNGKIPDYMNVCPYNHEDLSSCIKNSIMSLVPRLKNGIPELEIPSLEPLSINDISFHSGSDAANIATNISEIKIWGGSHFNILELKVLSKRNRKIFRFRVMIPHVYVEGNYEMNTKLLFLNLNGQGPFKANITNYYFNCTLKGYSHKVGGSNHLKFEKFKCSVKMGSKMIYLENLFADNKLISEAANGIINDNSDALFREIKPGLVSSIDKKFLDMANKITLTFTYEELFP